MRIHTAVGKNGLLVLFAGLLLALHSEATKKPPLEPININTATAEELQQVPGIGPVTADKILKMRKVRGRFKSVNELRAIKGIGPKRLAKMKPYLTVSDVQAPVKPQAETKAAAPPQ